MAQDGSARDDKLGAGRVDPGRICPQSQDHVTASVMNGNLYKYIWSLLF